MTLKQLLNETYALGFEDTGEISDGFIFSANRALVRIVSELGADSLACVSVPSDGAKLIRDKLRLDKGTSASFTVSGCAYSLLASGRGTVKIEADGKVSVIPFSGACSVIRGFITADATLTVSADTRTDITDLCTFEFTDALSESEIPLFGDARKIPLSSLIPDFFRVSAPLENTDTDRSGKLILTGDSIYPERGFSGKVTVRYKRYPKSISKDTPESQIDIPRELESLLPLLTASYVWLDDDAERAQYYLELYLAEASRIKKSFPGTFCAFRNVTGWA